MIAETDSKNSGQARQCQNCKTEFIVDQDDANFYAKIKVPVPTFCPLCRFERRAVYRNEGKLFRVKDAITGNDILSLWPQTKNRKVITQEEWYGDTWDPFDYGKDYDFSRPFFEQIAELEALVPIYNLNVKLMVNSPYSGNATALKNCYLCFNSNYSEDSLYSNALDYSKDCVDNSHINHSERCYECFWVQNCYQCYFTIMSVDSHNLWFCRDCLGCSNCFGCVNLRKASYCIFNQKYSKEEYELRIKEMRLHTYTGLKMAYSETRNYWKTQINKEHQGLQNLNSTGSYVSNSKNVRDCYLVRESENLRYCQYLQVSGNKDCYDVMIWGEHTELSYETSISGENSYNLKFCLNCWPSCRDSEYCINLFSSADCFGCVGLKNAQYCVFNKQYSKEEYKILVTKIKDHMDKVPYVDSQGLIYKYGEFFPAELSPFGYNNSLAIQYFNLTKKEIETKGYKWFEPEQKNYQMTIYAKDIPDSIDDVTESISAELIECEKCKNVFRIMPEELLFLKKEKLPLPHMCIDCRKSRRLNDRLPLKLFERPCMCEGEKSRDGMYENVSVHQHGTEKCTNTFKTGFDPEKNDIVYCESCYQQEMV